MTKHTFSRAEVKLIEEAGTMEGEEFLLNALSLFSDGIRNIEIARHIISERIKNPRQGDSLSALYINLGDLYLEIFQIEKAKECFKESVEALLPDASDEERGGSIGCYGWAFNLTGDYAEAERLCREAISIDPHTYNHYKNLGMSLEGQGRYEAAIEAYLKAAELNPNDKRALGCLGNLLKRNPDLKSSEIDERVHALQLKHPRSEEAFSKLLKESLEMSYDDFIDAVSRNAQRIKTRPLAIAMLKARIMGRRVDAELERWYLILGQICEQDGDYVEALAWYTQGLQLLSGNADEWTRYFIHNNPGYCLNILGDHLKAEVLCRKAIEISPEKHNAHKNLAISLEGQGRHIEAVDSYLKAITLCSDDTRSLNHLQALIRKEPSLLRDVPKLQSEMSKFSIRHSNRTVGKN